VKCSLTLSLSYDPKTIYRFLVAKFVWGLENVLPSNHKSKVGTEDVDEFVLLNEKIKIHSPITHTHIYIVIA
jgi:hypothetical protein